MIKLCVFDFDSTLMDGETITKFAEICGASDKVAQITKNAMAGNLDFFESLHARAKFLKGTKTEQIAKVAQRCKRDYRISKIKGHKSRSF